MSETKIYKDYKIHIVEDFDPINPRTDRDNLGTMVCFHRRYALGDNNHGWHDVETFLEYINQPPVSHKRKIKLVALPLYLYDHSGITMSTNDFSMFDPGGWDSGQVGVIYITAEKIEEEYGWKKLTKKRIEKIKEILKAEVEEYDQYLKGDVYGCKIEAPDVTEVESCWGFFGYNHNKNGLMDFAHGVIHADIERRLQNEGIQTKMEFLEVV